MKISKAEAIDFIILVFRWYIAFYMISYAVGKLTGEQFGVSHEMIAKPIKDLNPFYIAWYLFGQSMAFKIVVAVSQIVGSILILFPRTKLIGALVLLPILANIFLIDACFTTGVLGFALPVRLAGMLFADLMILYHNKVEVSKAWQNLTTFNTPDIKYKWWIYLMVPVLGFLMDFILAIALYPLRLVIQYWMHK